MSDEHAPGSSTMPQKKNPDVPELVRGRSGRAIGDLVAVLTMMKGLPLAYDGDLQEQRVPLYDGAAVAPPPSTLPPVVARVRLDPQAKPRPADRRELRAN